MSGTMPEDLFGENWILWRKWDLTKLTLPALMLAGALVIAAPGCKQGGQSGANSSGTSSSSASSSGTNNSAVDVTSVPSTTTIDGKSVPLQTTPSGLKYYDIKVGTGPSPKSGQTVSVQYTGTLLDGTKFDSSYDHGSAPFDFPVGGGQVIKGWDEGVLPMKVGGKRRLVVPGDLAYGANSPTPAIPANATLVFDVELVGLK